MEKDLFYNMKGNNIYLKPLSMDHDKEIHEFASDPEVSRYIGWKLMTNLEETRELIKGMLKKVGLGNYYASVVLKSQEKIIGTIMLFNIDKLANHGEVGYVFHKDYWGKGYGSEALALLEDFAFKELKLNKVHARVVDTNLASSRILEKKDFDLEGRLRDYYFIDGRYLDGLFYGKINSKGK